MPVNVDAGAGVGAIFVVGLHVHALRSKAGRSSLTLPERLSYSMISPYSEVGRLWSVPPSFVMCYSLSIRSIHSDYILSAHSWQSHNPLKGA